MQKQNFKKSSESWFKVLANEFELTIHEISHIIDAINGLHIPILVPKVFSFGFIAKYC